MKNPTRRIDVNELATRKPSSPGATEVTETYTTPWGREMSAPATTHKPAAALAEDAVHASVTRSIAEGTSGVHRTQEEWNRETDRVLGKVREHDRAKAQEGRPPAQSSYTNPWGRQIDPQQ